ncbi:MAG: Hsp20/alpha crystallin family protein [Deltaproteobacteria bacterium]|nr:Hsp20/alpha crystallin family protein [Deltaproteobacteria bacterium]
MRSLIPWRRGEVESREHSLATLRREMDDLFDSFFGSDWFLSGPYSGRKFVPAFDISETENEFVVKAELPGVDTKEVQVNLTGNVVTVSGEKKEEREQKSESVHRVERAYGSFTRSFTIPGDIQEDKAEASYKDGVLTLKLPKAESSKKKTIKIELK